MNGHIAEAKRFELVIEIIKILKIRTCKIGQRLRLLRKTLLIALNNGLIKLVKWRIHT